MKRTPDKESRNNAEQIRTLSQPVMLPVFPINIIKYSVIFFLLSLLVFSCKKDKEDEVQILQAVSPRFNYMAGTYPEDINLELMTPTPNAIIYYTLDGSVPDTNSNIYSNPIEIKGDVQNILIRTFCTSPGYYDGDIVASYYNIDYSYNENEIIDTLEIDDFEEKLIGYWVGYFDGFGPGIYQHIYNVMIHFKEDGWIEARSISKDYCNYCNVNTQDYWNSVLYYLKDEETLSAKVLFYDVYNNREAVADLYLLQDGESVIYGKLDHLRFLNEFNNLIFNYAEGDITYRLTRYDPNNMNIK